MNTVLRRDTPVLVDTNVIIESQRTRTWTALTSGYRIQTVEDCVTETQTGYPRRSEEQLIDLETLRASLRKIIPVQEVDRATLALRVPNIALDLGERSLWAHALGRTENWVLCSPDKASLRCGISLGLRDRLVSLEELLVQIGHRVRVPLRQHYTKSWMVQTCTEILLSENSSSLNSP